MKLLSSPNDRGIVAVHEHGLDVYPLRDCPISLLIIGGDKLTKRNKPLG